MAIANFKSIFESGVSHIESLNIRNASKVSISTDNLGVTTLDADGNVEFLIVLTSSKTLTK